MNKRYFILLIALCMVLNVGCTKTNNNSVSVRQLDVEAGVAYVALQNGANLLWNFESSENSDFVDFVQKKYGFTNEQFDSINAAALVYEGGVSASEFFVIKTEDVSKVKPALSEYLKSQTSNYSGYAPAEEAKLKNAEIYVCESYVILFVCDDVKRAKNQFKKLLYGEIEVDNTVESAILNWKNKKAWEIATTEASTEATNDENQILEDKQAEIASWKELEEVEGVIEIYDTTHIADAYKADDESLLSDVRDRFVLKECKRIIAENITEGMSDYEMEKAIHDYMVNTFHYDVYAIENSGWYKQYTDQPFGALYSDGSICVGYATTFKLFMDMLDIECIIVKGCDSEDGVNHAWNKVKLNDQWYNVDVTWDDPIGGSKVYYNYFNISDETMEKKHHSWDKDKYPESPESYIE